MSIEAMKQMVEALKKAKRQCHYHNIPPHGAYDDAIKAGEEAIASLRQAIAATEESSAVQGCEFCKHPLFAGTKCKNCGTQSKAGQCQYPNCNYPCMNLPDCKDGIKWSDYESDGRIIKNYPEKDKT